MDHVWPATCADVLCILTVVSGSLTVPDTGTWALFVSDPETGAVIVTTGATVSSVSVTIAVAWLFARSFAVTVIVFNPSVSGKSERLKLPFANVTGMPLTWTSPGWSSVMLPETVIFGVVTKEP